MLSIYLHHSLAIGRLFYFHSDKKRSIKNFSHIRMSYGVLLNILSRGNVIDAYFSFDINSLLISNFIGFTKACLKMPRIRILIDKWEYYEQNVGWSGSIKYLRILK